MSKRAIIVAIFFPSTVFAVMPVLAPTAALEQSHRASVIGTHRGPESDHLSMGPDTGAKTGDAATPTTTKTGQPTNDGTSASNQSGASSTPASKAASDRTDSSTGPTSGSDTRKQQQGTSGK